MEHFEPLNASGNNDMVELRPSKIPTLELNSNAALYRNFHPAGHTPGAGASAAAFMPWCRRKTAGWLLAGRGRGLGWLGLIGRCYTSAAPAPGTRRLQVRVSIY